MGPLLSKNRGSTVITSSASVRNPASSSAPANDDYIEQVVCKVSDIKENEMKEVVLGEGKVLLVNQGGQLSAVGTKCTHYSAPLVKGVLSNGHIRCPWHGACFNAVTGDIEDFPGLNSIPAYQVTVVGEDVKVKASKAVMKANSRSVAMTALKKSNASTVLIIGGVTGFLILFLRTMPSFQTKFKQYIFLQR